MKMTLLSMDIESFKGISKLHIDFAGKNANIYGDNATGKTTIYDALTWLLFNKDSHGAAKFEIKPLGEDGAVCTAGVMPTVTAVLDVDGVPVVLKKALREKWERIRGSVEQRFAGNTTDYFKDDVPRQEQEFKRLIAEIVDEDVFRQLTSVHFFCSDLKWQDRRKQLFKLCNVASDEVILATAPEQFTELRSAIGRRTVDEYRDAMAVQRRNAKSTLDGLPIRIDEQNKTILAAGTLDYTALRAEESVLAAQREQLGAELVKLENNTLLAGKQNELAAIKTDMRQLDIDNREHRQAQERTEVDRRPELIREVQRLKGIIADYIVRKCAYEARIEESKAGIEKCRSDWNTIDAREFTSSDICQLCGQKLPPDQIEGAMAAFSAQKDADKIAVVELSDSLKAQVAADEAKLAELTAERADYEKSLANAQAKFDACEPPKTAVVTDMPDYESRFQTMTKTLSALEGEISGLRGETAGIRQSTQEKIAALDAQLREVRGRLLTEQTIENARQRIAELQGEQRKTAAFQENCDRMIELCEDFVRYKVQSITDAVNSKFSFVRFRLFTEQVNGGLSECCDATVHGVPYDSMNSASKINAGLDVIAALSAHSSVRVPLFVDNAESVTQLRAPDTQVVRLVVSAADKELRVEV